METFNIIEPMHDANAKQPNFRCLFEICSEQQGLFTTTQAEACGYTASLRSYHLGKGKWTRRLPGVYQLSEYPESKNQEVFAAWLWAGKSIAVVSHETALDLLELADVIPDAIDITLPRSVRYRRAPEGIALHTTIKEFAATDTVVRTGIRLTSPVRTILDCAEAGTAPEQIVAAVRNALARGLTSPSRLESAANARGQRVRNMISRGVSGAPA